MTNYRRYSPYRTRRSPTLRPLALAGWAVVIVVLIVLVRNSLGGSGGPDGNSNGDIRLAEDSNTNTVPLASAPTIAGREITTADCSRPISKGSTGQPYVALTLDGGGILGDAPRVLEVLREQQVPATLFVTGEWAEKQTETVKGFSEAGIDVFSHSYNHDSYKGMEAEKIRTDLTKADVAISDVTGRPTKPYFRPPLGDYDTAALAELRAQGYCAILWTVDAQDWREGATVDDATTRVIDALTNDAIIMLQANSDIAVALIPRLVSEVRAKGYSFVTLRDLLRRPAGESEESDSTNANENTNTSSNRNSNTNVSSNKNSSANVNTNSNRNTNSAKPKNDD